MNFRLSGPQDSPTSPDDDDFVTVADSLTPSEAQMLVPRLQSAGVHARADDLNTLQVHPWLSAALGGARLRVPRASTQRALDVIAAWRRGDFALDDDADAPGDPGSAV